MAALKFRYPGREGYGFDIQCPHMALVPWTDEQPGTLWHTLPLTDNDRGWQLQQADPLTITPSIKIGNCGCHGFITEGVWVPCDDDAGKLLP
jgi:hypothetical protein